MDPVLTEQELDFILSAESHPYPADWEEDAEEAEQDVLAMMGQDGFLWTSPEFGVRASHNNAMLGVNYKPPKRFSAAPVKTTIEQPAQENSPAASDEVDTKLRPPRRFGLWPLFQKPKPVETVAKPTVLVVDAAADANKMLSEVGIVLRLEFESMEFGSIDEMAAFYLPDGRRTRYLTWLDGTEYVISEKDAERFKKLNERLLHELRAKH